jgi:hypothetical protein
MIFISLSILGPSAFPGVEKAPGASQSFPIWVALVLTGVMPIVPWLKDLA